MQWNIYVFHTMLTFTSSSCMTYIGILWSKVSSFFLFCELYMLNNPWGKKYCIFTIHLTVRCFHAYLFSPHITPFIAFLLLFPFFYLLIGLPVDTPHTESDCVWTAFEQKQKSGFDFLTVFNFHRVYQGGDLLRWLIGESKVQSNP